jgi:hypothetical protein
MTEQLPLLLVCVAIIVVLAILIYVSGRGQISELSAVDEVRLPLQQILANTQNIDHSLDQQRHVFCDAHKRISAVTKGVQNPAL